MKKKQIAIATLILLITALAIAWQWNFRTKEYKCKGGSFKYNYRFGELASIEYWNALGKIEVKKFRPEWWVIPDPLTEQPAGEVAIKIEFDSNGDGILDTRTYWGFEGKSLISAESNINSHNSSYTVISEDHISIAIRDLAKFIR